MEVEEGSMYYASIGIIAIIILVIVNFQELRKGKAKNKVKIRAMYRIFLFSLIIYFCTDAMWGLFYGQRWVAATYIDTMLVFSTMVLSVLLWTKCVVIFTEAKGKPAKILVGCGWFIFGVEVIVLVINLFVPIVFSFNEEKEYLALPARYITLFMQMILFFSTAIYSFIISARSKGDRRSHYRTVGFSGIIMAVFIALQMLFPFMPLYALGCLFATCAIHTFVYRDKDIEHDRELSRVSQKAYRDGLTGVKNKLAYLESLRDMELQIQNKIFENYGVVVFDLNGLKIINDTLGHEAGDEYLREACRLICEFYKHSPVYRIGGDEFVAILKGSDFENRHSILEQFDKLIDENVKNKGVIVSSGMAVFDPKIDESYTEVFIRADKKMYERKVTLKSLSAH